MSELFTDPKPDRFEHESPLRAFTEFNKHDWYAIGKGFRPSLQHLPVYLDAIRRKENWRLLQVLESTTGSPSFVFERDAPINIVTSYYDDLKPLEPSPEKKAVWDEVAFKTDLAEEASRAMDSPYSEFARAYMYLGADAERKIGVSPALGAPYSPIMPEIKHTPAAQEAKAMLDDPISPAHYDGTECMEIVDNLPGNLAHAFTYLWRAGRKPGVPAKEDLAKARRFLEREVHLQGFPNGEMAEDADEGDDVSPYDYTLPGQTRFYYMRARLASKRASENPFIPFAAQRIQAKLGESQNARLCRAVVAVVGLADYKIRRDVRAIIREVDAWIECIDNGGEGGCTGYGRQLEP